MKRLKLVLGFGKHLSQLIAYNADIDRTWNVIAVAETFL